MKHFSQNKSQKSLKIKLPVKIPLFWKNGPEYITSDKLKNRIKFYKYKIP